MVNEPISVNGNPGTSGDDPLGPLVIEDTTSPDQLEREADVILGADLETPEQQDVVAGAPTDTVGGAGLEPEVPPVGEQANTPPTADEVKRLIDERTAAIQSAADRRVAEEAKQRRLAEERNAQVDLEARIEATLRQQEKTLAETMGPEDARAYVRGANADNVKAQLTYEAENTQLKQQAAQSGIQNRSYLMREWITDVQQRNSLSLEDAKVLESLVTQDSLQNDEAFISVGDAIAKVAERLKGRTTSVVPRGTPETNPGTGRSTNSSPTSDASLTASAREKPGWAWTDAERAAMRRSSFGG